MSKDLLNLVEKKQLESAIKEAEKNTSGEIRVHIEKKCEGDVLDRAAYLFDLLEMQKTKLRNSVLIYLAVDNRQLAILGDAGINQKVPVDFWDKTKDLMVEHFKKGDFFGGLSGGVLSAGNQLKKYFPSDKSDTNELNNEISLGD
ncbi:MAG: TPM domain-containing protein [Flavobacteriales bacterium]|nr:TPM domain-containing protein [Flavobacteriales bacterium]